MMCSLLVCLSPYLVNHSLLIPSPHVPVYQCMHIMIWSNAAFALICMVCQYFGKSPKICNYIPAAMS